MKRRTGALTRSRSEHKPRPNDFYATPISAILPLLPFLNGVRTFAEPCAGAGDLMVALEAAGLRCTYAGDVAWGMDALATADYGGAEVIVTNPPFSLARQPLLRRMMAHFPRIAPTWLLLPADFACNIWFASFLPACTDLVPIGRVKWLPGTPSGSVENFAWFRFEAGSTSGPIFHARGSAPNMPPEFGVDFGREASEALAWGIEALIAARQ
jgi:hypothetical protein